MELLLTTERGIEEVAAQEVRELTRRSPVIDGGGRLLLRGEVEDILTLNYCSNSLHRVVLLLHRGEVQDLQDIYGAVRRLPFEEYISPGQTFAVRASRMGEHSFTSMDIARVAGQAVIDSYASARGVRLRVNLDTPEVVVRIELRQRLCYVGIDTTGESLHRRGYRVYQHPAPLKPSICHALVRIADWSAEEALLDPFCGSGTICIEAARYALRMPNQLRRDSFLFWNLGFLPLERFRELIRRFDARVLRQELKIRGCDISPKHVAGARMNAERAGVRVDFHTCDATRVPLDSDRIVTNLPYGLRMGSVRKIRRLYREFERNLSSGSWRRAVILTARPEFFSREPDRRIDIVYGRLPTAILVFEG
ncbi:MAG: class I SAM-dependent RNA methyltransferase [Euryarchaeota archaeon]|nr:class I SAM-dependent RNA methyltransferase [Euryarchaeota archaeon]